MQVGHSSGPSWWPDLLCPCAQSEGSPSKGPLRGHCYVHYGIYSEEFVSTSLRLIQKPLAFHGRSGLERTHLGIYAGLWFFFFHSNYTDEQGWSLLWKSREISSISQSSAGARELPHVGSLHRKQGSCREGLSAAFSSPCFMNYF